MHSVNVIVLQPSNSNKQRGNIWHNFTTTPMAPHPLLQRDADGTRMGGGGGYMGVIALIVNLIILTIDFLNNPFPFYIEQNM